MIGKRIQFFRNKINMTQKQLGIALGFPENSSDVRIAQYESGSRKPKKELIRKMALIFGVSPRAISVPDMDDCIGLMHTLFAVEDIYGLNIGKVNGEVCLDSDRTANSNLSEMLRAWQMQAARLEQGEITKDEYDFWRYNFPSTVLYGLKGTEGNSNMYANPFNDNKKILVEESGQSGKKTI